MSRFTINRQKGRRSGRNQVCPRLERLEGRTTPSTFVVTNPQDSGEGSLRWALGRANAHAGDDVIRFAPSLAGKTIHLSSGLVANDTSGRTVVVGPGAASLTVAGPGGKGPFDAFTVRPRASLDLSGLTLSRAGVSNNGTATLTNCTVAGNRSWGVDNSGTATLTNCTVAGNWGVGVLSGGTATLTNCTVAGNRSGGVSTDGTATLTNCTVAGNQYYGVVDSGTATLTSCTVAGNRGDGVVNYGTATLTSCTVAGNQAAGVVNSGTATLTNCTLASNRGDGVFTGGTATLTSCTVAGNRGAGVSNNGTATLTNCTVAGNQGVGLSNFYFYGSSASAVNSILWGNRGAGGRQVSDDAGMVSVRHSIVQGGWQGQDNTAADPLFLDVAQGDYRLRPGSPAIDSGETVPLPGIDRAGNPRVLDGDRDGQAVVDLGAYEFGRPFVTLSSEAPGRARAAILVRVTFSDPVAGFTAADVSAVNAAVSGFTGSGARYSFTLTPTLPGPFSARVVPGAARDGTGAASTASNTLQRVFVAPLLAFQGVPAQAVAGAPLPEVAVQLRDGQGRPVPLAGRLVTLSLPGGALAGTLTALTDASGRAVFRDLRVLTAGTYRLRASGPGLADAWSDPFAVSQEAPAWARLFPGWARLPARLRAALLGLPWPGP